MIPLPKKDEERLNRLAFRYGLSLPTLAARILVGVSEEIPFESLDEYDNPKEIKQSLARALKEAKAGKLVDALPQSIVG
ncbi:hypothetical protein HYZ64_02975 [Candidatus Berkelbacteria bacterium]|nr:hypothetical protein [Candidatus Berkelbacteria bacterium]